MTVSDNTIQTEGFGSFFKTLGRVSAKLVEKLATNVLKYPGRAFEIGANFGTEFATQISKEALSSLPGVIIFYPTGSGLCLGKFA